MLIEEQKFTSFGNNYFDGTGVYQSENETLFNLLVPAKSHPDTLHGKLVQAANNLTYEYFNNGNCNARGGDFCKSDIPKLNESHEKFLDFIDTHVEGTSNLIENIKNVILSYYGTCEDDSLYYTELMDRVMYFCLTTENRPL